MSIEFEYTNLNSIVSEVYKWDKDFKSNPVYAIEVAILPFQQLLSDFKKEVYKNIRTVREYDRYTELRESYANISREMRTWLDDNLISPKDLLKLLPRSVSLSYESLSFLDGNTKSLHVVYHHFLRSIPDRLDSIVEEVLSEHGPVFVSPKITFDIPNIQANHLHHLVKALSSLSSFTKKDLAAKVSQIFLKENGESFSPNTVEKGNQKTNTAACLDDLIVFTNKFLNELESEAKKLH